VPRPLFCLPTTGVLLKQLNCSHSYRGHTPLYLSLSSTVLQGTLVFFKNEGTSLWNLFLHPCLSRFFATACWLLRVVNYVQLSQVCHTKHTHLCLQHPVRDVECWLVAVTWWWEIFQYVHAVMHRLFLITVTKEWLIFNVVIAKISSAEQLETVFWGTVIELICKEYLSAI